MPETKGAADVATAAAPRLNGLRNMERAT